MSLFSDIEQDKIAQAISDAEKATSESSELLLTNIAKVILIKKQRIIFPNLIWIKLP